MAIVNDKNRHPTTNQRLEILQAVERSGNVSQACLQYKVSRASYYAWLRKYKEDPLSGLKPKKRIPKSSNKTPQDVVERVVDLAIRNPDSGCSKIADLLLKGGAPLSPPTVQKILNKEGLGTVSRRLFRLEKHHFLDGWQVTDRQLELINRNDPCLKERNKTGSHPGEILVQDCFPIFQLIPGCYIHVVIDTYSSTAFIYPWFEKSSFIAADVLQTLAFRKFRLADFSVRKVLTSNAYIFSRHGKKYSDTCKRNNVLHEIYTGKDRNWNGHIEKFKKFFMNKYRHLKTEKLDAAQLTEIFRIMKHPAPYGRTKVFGFPNFWMTPEERIARFRASIANVTL
jgi:transposase-like protein